MISLIKNNYKKIIFLILIISIIIWFLICIKIPNNFPVNTIFHISKNTSISSISESLYNKNIISSKFIFKFAVILISKNKGILAGDYKFNESQNMFVIAQRMVRGDQGLPKVKVTIPEGTNVYDMAYIYMTKLTNFDAPHFVAVAKPYEGYLFPDTYYFLSNTSAEQIIREMRANFDKKINPLKDEITKYGRTLKDTITMASIVEEEAKGLEDKRMVAGVLWKRLDKGMLLQVDPPFYYITGKTSGVIYDDLKIDSLYNTYKYKGLPKGPISNPGLESIQATISPIKSDYYFYLTGRDGKMRYASTYDGHLANKNTYLK
jgi:UPF0755 protein